MTEDQTPWWALVDWLGQAPDAAQLDEAERRVAGWSPTLQRTLPLRWLERLARGEQVPAAQLVNTVDLGNGLSLTPGGFDDFFTLTRPQLSAFLQAPLGPASTLVYADDVVGHPLHPGFVVDTDDAIALMSGPWDTVRWLRLDGWGIHDFTRSLLEAAGKMPAVKRLSLNQGEWHIDEEALTEILSLPIMAQIERLDLEQYWAVLDPRLAEQIAASPAIQGLRELHLGELPSDLAAIMQTLRDHGVDVSVEAVD